MAKKPGGYARGLSKGWGRYWPGVAIVEEGPTGPYLIRPGQLLAAPQHANEVRGQLPDDWVDQRPLRDDGQGIVLFRLRDHPDVLRNDAGQQTVDKVHELRGKKLRVSANHVLPGQQVGGGPPAIVFAGCPRLMGGPGALVAPAAKPAGLSDLDAADGQGVKVAILDTGVWREHPWLEPGLSAAVAADQPNAENGWDVDGGGILDAEAGHGTFIAGQILQVATGADVVPRRVLSSQGVGDDVEIAQAIAALPADIKVINLSLGGYTADDQPPMALESELTKRIQNGAVVAAAAGNSGADRKFWPAAMPDVVGVAAVDDNGALAPFSNYGDWVTACAPGVDRVSSFFAAQTSIGDGAGHITMHAQIDFEGWARWSGTSMAAPLIAAGVAVLVGLGSDPEQALAQLLADFSDPAGDGVRLPNARCLNLDRLQAAGQDGGLH